MDMENRSRPSDDYPDQPEHIRRMIDIHGIDGYNRIVSQVDYSNPETVFRAMGMGSVPGGLPMPTMITIEEVNRRRATHVHNIFLDWQSLKDVLVRHEATIQKRWAKKTKAQRLKVLLTAWPKMPDSHRPDYVASRKENNVQRQTGSRYRDAYLWPYINQEDLSKPKTLPLFLNSRGRHTPDLFAIADHQAAHLAFVTTVVTPPFINNYTMYFSGRSTPDRYAEVVGWDDDNDAFMDMNSQKALQPGPGLILLEIQERLYRFLLDCCKEIMHDIPSDALNSDQYSVQPEPTAAEEDSTGFASLAVMAANAPYRVPAQFDLARLQSLLAAKVNAVEDEIWAMREDPSYFAESLVELKEHQQESFVAFMQTGPLWAKVIGLLVGNAYRMFELWHELHIQVVHLKQLHDKYGATLKVEDDLPEEYLLALLKFRHHLEQAAKGPLAQLQESVLPSPPIRRNFHMMANGTKVKITQKPGASFSKVESELLQLLKILWEDDYQLFLTSQIVAVDELERLIQSEPEAKKCISSYVAGVIADLSILTEASRQLSIFQPWAQQFEDQALDHAATIETEYSTRTKPWDSFLRLAEGPQQSKLIRLGEPSEGRFFYPVDKRRTRENVEAMRTAEHDLDTFWAAMDEAVRVKFGDELSSTAVWELLSRPRSLRRTPKWEEPGKVKQGQRPSAEVDALVKPLSELYFDLEHRTERTLDRTDRSTALKAKQKTRGITAPQLGAAHEGKAPPPSVVPDKQPAFAVDARALKVFHTLFYHPSASATPGEVAWTDFLHAMSSTGFGIEKLYGSVWQFQPTRLDVERSIQFHEPHPSGKLAYRVARRFGRRLERAYGWVGDMFELKEKAVNRGT